MAKIYRILVVISVVIIAVIFFFKFAAKTGKQEVQIEHQQQQIEEQNVIIKTNREIQQRKAVAKAVDPNTNLDWLRAHRCKDCAG